MLKKILSIENVGIFKNYKGITTGDWDGKFENKNLIYAENGQGKTTITTILRSLKNQDSKDIVNKKTLDVSEDEVINIEVISDKGKIDFKNQNWNDCLKEIQIFDSNFVSKNIYNGHDIKHEHKKNLHSFVIGEKGVSISKRISDIKDERGKLKTELNNLECDINKCSNNLSTKEFVNLEKEDEINKKIEDQKNKVDKLKRNKQIKDKDLLKSVSIPNINKDEIKSILNKSLEDMRRVEKVQQDNLERIRKK